MGAVFFNVLYYGVGIQHCSIYINMYINFLVEVAAKSTTTTHRPYRPRPFSSASAIASSTSFITFAGGLLLSWAFFISCEFFLEYFLEFLVRVPERSIGCILLALYLALYLQRWLARLTLVTPLCSFNAFNPLYHLSPIDLTMPSHDCPTTMS